MEFKQIYLEVINQHAFTIHEVSERHSNSDQMWGIIYVDAHRALRKLRRVVLGESISERILEIGEVTTLLGDTIRMEYDHNSRHRYRISVFINNKELI